MHNLVSLIVKLAELPWVRTENISISHESSKQVDLMFHLMYSRGKNITAANLEAICQLLLFAV